MCRYKSWNLHFTWVYQKALFCFSLNVGFKIRREHVESRRNLRVVINNLRVVINKPLFQKHNLHCLQAGKPHFVIEHQDLLWNRGAEENSEMGYKTYCKKCCQFLIVSLCLGLFRENNHFWKGLQEWEEMHPSCSESIKNVNKNVNITVKWHVQHLVVIRICHE